MAYDDAVIRPTNLQFVIPCLIACICVANAEQRRITGTYRNPALGYSIRVPQGLNGVTGDQAGPERGLRISLPSGGVISVWGEPNSLEWKTPEQGVRWALISEKCASSQKDEVSAVPVGKLSGVKGVLVCRDRVLKIVLVFRPGGGPIYWLRLETASTHGLEDEAVFHRVAATFILIPWK